MSILKSTNLGWNSYAVDLGLSVRWCSCNVGANKPEEAGKYFAWGDVQGAVPGDLKYKPYLFFEEWYNDYVKFPKIIHDMDLNAKNDAAHEYLKSKWRMPTNDECFELMQNTKQFVETVNGVDGMRFTGYTGNSIFIPFAKLIRCGIKSEYGGFNLWTSTGFNTSNAYAYFGDRSGYFGPITYSNFVGMSIRGVYPLC